MMPTDHCRPFPLTAFAIVSTIAIGAVAFMGSDPRTDLQPFFGGMPPVLGGLIAAIAGGAALYAVQSRLGFCVWRRNGMKRFVIVAGLAVPFMVAITVLDLATGFPADINVPLPMALLFYPVMGFFAQLSLHVIPFAVVVFALRAARPGLDRNMCIWTGIVLASLIEAVFQIRAPLLYGDAMTMQAAILAIHVFLFGCVELLIYRRYDFAAMYAFRLSYYAYWHVIWGWLRL